MTFKQHLLLILYRTSMQCLSFRRRGLSYVQKFTQKVTTFITFHKTLFGVNGQQ